MHDSMLSRSAIAGSTLPLTAHKCTPYPSHAQLKHPHGPLDFDHLVSDIDNAFLLKARASGLELKGQMVAVPLPLHPGAGCPATQEGLLFMGTARLAGLDDMRHHGIFISDIPHHDINRDYVLLAEQRQAEAQLQERLESLTRELKVPYMQPYGSATRVRLPISGSLPGSSTYVVSFFSYSPGRQLAPGRNGGVVGRGAAA